jgi:CBS domain-containing protein
VPDLRPRGLACAEDELVEELDRKQDRDEAGGSAPAERTELAGRPRQRHGRIVHQFGVAVPRGHPTRRTEKGEKVAHIIRELMTENPRTVSPDQTVQDAARIMRDEDTGVVPITEGENLVGVITDRDIAIRAIAEGKDGQTPVREVASQDLVTIDPQQDLDEALRLMAQHQVRRLPVVEEDGKLVGIVSQADVARHGDDARTGEVVEQISE